MKRILAASVLILSMAAVSAFAQKTTAPDDGTSASASVTNAGTPVTVTATTSNVTVTTNAASTNTSSVTVSSSSGASSSAIVTDEKEVKPASGVVYNDGKIDYASSNVLFTINARDSGSGVKAISLIVDDSQFGNYVKPLSFLTEGRHMVAWKVEDNVGNVTPLKFYQFILDTTAPELAINADHKSIQIGDVSFAATNWIFTLSAHDSLSGVKEIRYAVDDGATNVYDKAFSVSGSNGMHTIAWLASDNVGNVSETKTFKFFLDTVAPAVAIAVKPAAFETNGIKFISASSIITVNAKDAESSVAQVQVSIDGGDWKDYSFGFQLPSGAHTVKAKAVDLLGNVSQEAVLAVTVDSDMPESEIVPSK
jgi:hypothetical protein